MMMMMMMMMMVMLMDKVCIFLSIHRKNGSVQNKRITQCDFYCFIF